MYIYKLGHSPDFGLCEFEFLTKQNALWHNQNWLISGEFCDTSVCGSLVFGGQIENNLENVNSSYSKNNSKMESEEAETLRTKDQTDKIEDIEDFENVELENEEDNQEGFDKITSQIQIKSKNLQNTNNSLQNWNEESKIMGQKLEIDLENELENLDELDNKNVLEILGEFLQKKPYKKIGIAILTSFDQQKVMNLVKKCGSKKINIISCLPNYGHWKSCKKWIVIIQNPIRKISQKSQENSNDNNIETRNLQNLQFQKLVLFEINNFCNQEYWANLDQNLPSGEMSRGLMNLKLARTLVNLTDKKFILDPFCGSGRTMAAGFGLDKKFILSDIEKVCAEEVVNNLEFLKNEKNGKLWKKSQDLESENGLENDVENSLETKSWDKIENKESLIQEKSENNLNLNYVLDGQKIEKIEKLKEENMEAKSNKLLTNLTLDAKGLGQLQNQKELTNIDFGQVAIITEGFLGTNFKKMPTLKQIQTEFDNLEQIWTKTLSESAKIGIEEILFCLPFYNLKEQKSENFGENKHKTETAKVNHKKKFAEDSTSFDNKINPKTNFKKTEFEKKDENENKNEKIEKYTKDQKNENLVENLGSFDEKNREKNSLEKKSSKTKIEHKIKRKTKLIISNLAAKPTNYQSKSQTWTPKNNSGDENKNPKSRFAKSYSNISPKSYSKSSKKFSDKPRETVKSFGYKKYEKSGEVGSKFGKKTNFTSEFGTEFGEKKYEKKNYGKSQNKRGSLDYKFGKSDYKFDENSEDKMNKKSRRSFGNINKSGKPTSYKIRPKFETDNKERKESRESRESRINIENKYENRSENKQSLTTKSPKFAKSDNYKTKSSSYKPKISSTNSRFNSNDSKDTYSTQNTRPNNSRIDRPNLQNRKTGQNSEQDLRSGGANYNYSNFSKSQTWENSQKNYQNRWENANVQDSKVGQKLEKENYRDNYKKTLNPKIGQKDYNNRDKNDSKYEKKYETKYDNSNKNNPKFSETKKFVNSKKTDFVDKFKNTNKTPDFINKNNNSENKIKTTNQIILPPFLDKLIESSDYEFAWENKHLLYSRDASFVGHLVIKLKLKK